MKLESLQNEIDKLDKITLSENKMNIRNHFNIVFKPKDKRLWGDRHRILVRHRQLHKYIGQKNADKLIAKIQTFQGDNAVEKYTIKYRKQGQIILYAI